jgi:cobalamin-dependent methionine synthase I
MAATLTMRYSPGYGDWNLDVQPEILATLDSGRIRLTSNISHILIPEKSVTAIIGIKDKKKFEL